MKHEAGSWFTREGLKRLFVFVHKRLQSKRAHVADFFTDHFAVLYSNNGRETGYPVGIRDGRLRVDIDRAEARDAGVCFRDFVEDRFHLLAGSAPVRFEFEDLQFAGVSLRIRILEEKPDCDDRKSEEEK